MNNDFYKYGYYTVLLYDDDIYNKEDDTKKRYRERRDRIRERVIKKNFNDFNILSEIKKKKPLIFTSGYTPSKYVKRKYYCDYIDKDICRWSYKNTVNNYDDIPKIKQLLQYRINKHILLLNKRLNDKSSLKIPFYQK